jgi:hypothetical protein
VPRHATRLRARRLRARPGVLVVDIFVGLALLALALAGAAVILPLWGAAIAVVGLLTAVVGGAEWVLRRTGATHRQRLTPPLRRALHRLLHPLPPRPVVRHVSADAPAPLTPAQDGR